LNETPTDCRAKRGRTETERSGLGEKKMVYGKNECPPRPRFFAATFFVPTKLARRLFISELPSVYLEFYFLV